jgi:hypothetical protein
MSYDITSDADFVKHVVADAGFINDRYLYGQNGDIYWAVVDPLKYPLYVWQKEKGTYEEAAVALDAVVFSDGALMTLPPGGKPYGPVHSDLHNIDDPGKTPRDQPMYKLGRKKPNPQTGISFTDYVIEQGFSVSGFAEVITQLYPMILNGKGLSMKPGDPNYEEGYANFMNATGVLPGGHATQIVAWGLIGPPKSDGLIVVAGSDSKNDNKQKVVDAFLLIGVGASVAMDGSNSVMLGEHQKAWFYPDGTLTAATKAGLSGDKDQAILEAESWAKNNVVEKYGFSCGGK